MQHRMRTVTKSLICAGAALMLIGCFQKDPIHIGFVAGFSGRSSDLAVSGRDGVLLALEKWNEQGGIGGRKIELHLMDESKSEEPKGLNEMLSKGTLSALIGPMTSGAAVPLVPKVNEAKTLTLSPTVASGQFSGQDDWFFKVLSETKVYAQRTAQYHVQKGRTDFCAIWDQGNESYSKNWLSHFEEQLQKLNANISSNMPYVFENPEQFVGLVEQVEKKPCTSVLLIAPAKDAAQIVQQLRKQKTQKTIVTSEWAATEQFLQLGGSSVEGVYMAQFMNRESQQEPYQQFVADFTKRFGRAPGFAELAGFDTANVLFEAMKRAGTNVSAQNIKEKLLLPEGFEGIQQKIVFDAYGDAQRASFMTQIKDGQFKVISADEK